MSAYLPHTVRLRTFLAVGDLAGLVGAVWLAFLLRFGLVPGLRDVQWRELLAQPALLLWAALSGLLLNVAAELYEPEVLHRRREVAVRVTVAIAGWCVAMVLALYFRPDWKYGRGVLVLSAAFWALELMISRWVITAWRRRRTRHPALVVGDARAVRRFCSELGRRESAPWAPIDGSEVDLDGMRPAIAKHDAAIVVIAGNDEHTVEMGHNLVALHFAGVPVVAASEIWAWLEERLPLEALTPALFFHQPGFGAVHWTLFNRVTRLLDVFLASLLLLLAVPVLLAACALILLADGLPALYRQERVGQFGRHFTMVKLRTMRRDAEEGGPSFAGPVDPRTLRLVGLPLGRWLRRFRIDELPQLWNVIEGEMSLVGPRPERPEFVEQLVERIPFYAFRTAVPPGITGWAQVNTPYAASDLDDHRRKLEFDLYFIRERSLRLYLLTLLRTTSAALVGAREPLVAPVHLDDSHPDRHPDRHPDSHADRPPRSKTISSSRASKRRALAVKP